MFLRLPPTRRLCSSTLRGNDGLTGANGDENQTKAREKRRKLLKDREEKLRKQFQILDEKWENDVEMERLDRKEVEIWKAHREACRNGKLLYRDPETGLKVMTRWSHFIKGQCCGNACRHCIYEHEKVPIERQQSVKKVFNSAFWTFES